MRKFKRAIARTIGAVERNRGKLLATTVIMATGAANAQSDLTTVLSSVSGYQTAAIVIGASIIAWVIGKRIVKTFAKG